MSEFIVSKTRLLTVLIVFFLIFSFFIIIPRYDPEPQYTEISPRNEVVMLSVKSRPHSLMSLTLSNNSEANFSVLFHPIGKRSLDSEYALNILSPVIHTFFNEYYYEIIIRSVNPKNSSGSGSNTSLISVEFDLSSFRYAPQYPILALFVSIGLLGFTLAIHKDLLLIFRKFRNKRLKETSQINQHKKDEDIIDYIFSRQE